MNPQEAVKIAEVSRKMTRSKAIAAKCRDCIYDPKAVGLGTWRQQTEACTSRSCALWAFRPLSSGSKT